MGRGGAASAASSKPFCKQCLEATDQDVAMLPSERQELARKHVVKWGDGWTCSVHHRIINAKDGSSIPFGDLFPNRRARRARGL